MAVASSRRPSVGRMILSPPRQSTRGSSPEIIQQPPVLVVRDALVRIIVQRRSSSARLGVELRLRGGLGGRAAGQEEVAHGDPHLEVAAGDVAQPGQRLDAGFRGEPGGVVDPGQLLAGEDPDPDMMISGMATRIIRRCLIVMCPPGRPPPVADSQIEVWNSAPAPRIQALKNRGAGEIVPRPPAENPSPSAGGPARREAGRMARDVLLLLR